jgi:NAD dependent epimerase/dehydratase family enzyme
MPWIHIDDLTELYLRAVEDEVLQGPYNAVAPEQVTQSVFIKTAGRVLKRPILLPTIPAFLLKSVIGEMSQVVTEGSRVSSQRLMDTGFQFKHLQLNQALNDLLK